MADKIYILTITSKGKKGYILLPESVAISNEQLNTIIEQVTAAVSNNTSNAGNSFFPQGW
jgi:hypothetical protein